MQDKTLNKMQKTKIQLKNCRRSGIGLWSSGFAAAFIPPLFFVIVQYLCSYIFL